jgi:hypothetical protein
MADPELSAADRATRFWTHLTDPALWPSERLFFELYGQALQGRPHALPLLDGVVTDWVDLIAEPAVAAGTPPEVARATPGWSWRWPAGCCWTCWPPATSTACGPPPATPGPGQRPRRRTVTADHSRAPAPRPW